ncbi:MULTISPECIES: hypothetical protein [Streptomyces]|nr:MULTISPECIES: hypothetical protein [Streptomyces]MBW8090446.1 hypothetical protein [Streptomyces hygroscopicus subsp. hygroscopicus]MCO8302779.1 hypothetical protein [Streptomyces sp. RKCA744]MDP9612256.1 hypothetical protein [Streptomyces demainii]
MTSPTAGQVRPTPSPTGERPRPAWPVAGFVALLALLFALAYAAGTLTGPVAPGMRPAGGGGQEPGKPADQGDMGGMHGMGAPAAGAGPIGSR